MMSEGHVHHPNYVKIWAILVVLLGVSVVGAMTGIRSLIPITAFGVAVVKAFLVARNFMHVNVEKRLIGYLLITSLVFVLILFFGVAPDVMRHQGMHWNKYSAKQAFDAGIRNGVAKHE